MATPGPKDSEKQDSRGASPFRRLFGCSSPDTEPDPATALSLRDRNNIIETWALFRRETRNNAIMLFVAMFARYPDYQKMFPGFSDVPLEQIPQNRRAMAHALRVFYLITEMVDTLDDNDILIEIIRKNLRAHLNRPMGPEHYANLADLLIEVMQDKLRSRMTPAAVKAWKALFAFHQKVAEQVYEEHRKAVKKGRPLGLFRASSPPTPKVERRY
ncbi:globin-1-like [Haemaphysalis longicornis]